MSEARAITNVIGNGIAALVIAKWTGDLDMDTLARQLNSPAEQLDAQESVPIGGQ
jgi:aerobic C4-dicarboxylate transport protein